MEGKFPPAPINFCGWKINTRQSNKRKRNDILNLCTEMKPRKCAKVAAHTF